MFAHLHQISHHAAWRRQLELLLESTGDGLYGIDLKGRCIFINEAGARMLGYTPDEVLGRNMHYLIHHSRADASLMPVHDCRIFRAFQDGQGCRVDDEVLWRRDGSSFEAHYASYPILDGTKVLGAVVTFADITDRKQTERALQAAHSQLEARVAERTAELSAANARLTQARDALRRLSSHINTVREDERARVAREIHDELGASLTAMQLELNWLRQRVSADAGQTASVDRMLDVAQTAMASVRRIISDLRPGVLDHLGLWAALENLLAETQSRSQLQCRFLCDPLVERSRFGRQAEIAVYRIVQELVTNVRRHASARCLTLEAWPDGADLLLRVSDDGKGMIVPAQPTTFGLLGLHERAHAIGGRLQIHSAMGMGVKVELCLPGVLGR
jgi:PAS domain S-box-containing protein